MIPSSLGTATACHSPRGTHRCESPRILADTFSKCVHLNCIMGTIAGRKACQQYSSLAIHKQSTSNVHPSNPRAFFFPTPIWLLESDPFSRIPRTTILLFLR